MRRCDVLICALSAVQLVIGGCGNDGADSPPESLSSGAITIESDPLVLRIATPRGEFVSNAFVEVGTVSRVDSAHYYDPRGDSADRVVWNTATRALSMSADGRWLELDNGVRIALDDSGSAAATAITVDASDVDNAVLVRIVSPKSIGEPIFGFGENFSSAEASGSVREMQFRIDAESESGLNEVHVPVPLALWPARGVGLFVENAMPGAFDVGVARDDAVLATYTQPQRGAFAVHYFVDADPIGLMRTYATLTSTPALPPRWAFAPQQWRNEHRSSQEVMDDAVAMRQNDIPGSTIWIDNPWQVAYNDFRFDETRFEQIQQLIDRLTAMGYKILVWSTPYVNRDGPTAADFVDARDRELLVKGDTGAPFVFPWQDGPGALVDFSAAGASAWWQDRIRRVVSMGIDGFKLDFGEDVVPDLFGGIAPFRLAGGDAQTMHGRYTEGYHEAYLDALPAGDAFLITRSGYWGEQRVNTCIWPGDLDSDFSRHGVDNGDGQKNVGGLPAAIAGMLSLSASGYPFYGSDIGGFRDGPTSTETLIRWSQYAALGTIMQLGGGGRSHNPWDTTLFDAPALSVYRQYARLHMALVPYIYTLAVTAATDGTPVTRPTRLVFYDAGSDDATFLLGDALFVAPVVEPGATTRDVVLPPGDWINYWSGQRTTGDGSSAITAAAPLEQLPLWRRANTFLATYAREADTLVATTDLDIRSYAEPAFGRELALLITPDREAATITLHDGSQASAQVDGMAYSVDLTAGDEYDIITLVLDRGTSPVAALDGFATISLDGAVLTLAGDARELAGCAAPGCFWDDSTANRLRVRVHLGGGTQNVRISL